MNVLHLLISGDIGGIEKLAQEYALHSVHNNVFVMLWSGGAVAEQMKDNGLKVIELHHAKMSIIQSVRSLMRICNEFGIEVLVVQHEAPLLRVYALMLKRILKHLKVITYAHSNAEDICQINRKKGLWLRKLIFCYSFQKADKVIAISRSVKESIVKLFRVSERNVTVLYNGIDLEKFSDSEREQTSCLELIYVGRLIEEKGVQVTIEGLHLLADDIQYHFSIVGDGAYRPQLEMLVHKYSLEDRIDFLGMCDDVSVLLQNADVFVHMPVWEEGFGITIVEAMAKGLICICADSGAISEIISNGIDGYLVRKQDVNALADTLRMVNNISNEERDCIRRNAKLRAQDFSIDKYSAELDRIILCI